VKMVLYWDFRAAVAASAPRARWNHRGRLENARGWPESRIGDGLWPNMAGFTAISAAVVSKGQGGRRVWRVVRPLGQANHAQRGRAMDVSAGESRAEADAFAERHRATQRAVPGLGRSAAGERERKGDRGASAHDGRADRDLGIGDQLFAHLR
jgi:hypothetical protein